MEYYFYIELSRKVATRKNKAGMDTAVCRAGSEEEAIRQLLPEMRPYVRSVSRHRTMRGCYPNPEGILKDTVI